jgi:hypothetical protein
MTFHLAYNPTDGPVVIDTAGRVLGSREWGPVDAADDTAKQLLDADRLVRVDKPVKGANDDALAAAKETDRLNSRANQFQSKASKESMTAVARDAGLIGDADSPTVAELVALLVRTDVPIPTSEPAAPAKES